MTRRISSSRRQTCRVHVARAAGLEQQHQRQQQSAHAGADYGQSDEMERQLSVPHNTTLADQPEVDMVCHMFSYHHLMFNCRHCNAKYWLSLLSCF